MDTKHPAQTLGIYEGELVQKVYWVDGKNQPRSINIVADKLRYNKDISELTEEEKSKLYPQGCFDFTQELELNEEVTVTREEGGGAFSPGTIQYAFPIIIDMDRKVIYFTLQSYTILHLSLEEGVLKM